MTIAYLNSDNSVEFERVHQLIAYMEKNHMDRIGVYALQRTKGVHPLDAWVTAFAAIVTLQRGTSIVPLLLQEMDLTVQPTVAANMAAIEVHDGVGAFLHGEPVWTVKDSEQALQQIAGSGKRLVTRKAAEAELATVRERIKANGHSVQH
ncbi:hypothetical protein [Cupriavidus pauculus]|uniref:Uncharacterized protein n=1 Tax=Cupriavidus pauculus TaxID=82633 RepID=A0A2N5C9M0_9BURK|nr:hypothetical protein [Cupriavidus pauculus]PLP98891.1 hypothetical protein CYJ10_19070 [Cupriavidus pauculus]